MSVIYYVTLEDSEVVKRDIDKNLVIKFDIECKTDVRPLLDINIHITNNRYVTSVNTKNGSKWAYFLGDSKCVYNFKLPVLK